MADMETRVEIPRLADYSVSETFGFLLVDTVDSLPEYFKPWEKTAKNLAELLSQHQLRNVVDEMSLLDHSRLESYQEQRLAQLFLAYLASGYVWQEGDEGVVKVLPRQVSIPLCALCDIMGGQPAVNHMTQALANYTLKDPQGPIHMSNMRGVCMLPSPKEHEYFVLVTLQLELEAIPGIKAGVQALECVKNQDEEGLIKALEIMTATARNIKDALQLMHKYVTAETFYKVFRPFLAGWNESSALPNGLIYEGVSEIPRKVAGGSAAQSSVMQSFDAILGVTHKPEKAAFLDSMMDYMPTPHKDFILALRKCVPVMHLVQSSGNTALTEAYNACISAFKDFRSYHLQIVSKYIIVQTAKSSKHVYEGIAFKGTGGTDLMPFLKSIRDTTAEAGIN